MYVTTSEDTPFLVRRVVREELVRLQAGDVHHQCSFTACPEPPPYWMRERHVENRPRTETADFTPRLPFSPTGRGHHRMSSSRRAAADLRSSSTRPLPEDYYASSQNVPAKHDPSPRTSATSAPANRVPRLRAKPDAASDTVPLVAVSASSVTFRASAGKLTGATDVVRSRDAIDGHACLWVLNAASEPVVLPAGFKLRTFEEQATIDVRMVSESPAISQTAPNYSTKIKRMINKSLPSSQQNVLEESVPKHLITCTGRPSEPVAVQDVVCVEAVPTVSLEKTQGGSASVRAVLMSEAPKIWEKREVKELSQQLPPLHLQGAQTQTEWFNQFKLQQLVALDQHGSLSEKEPALRYTLGLGVACQLVGSSFIIPPKYEQHYRKSCKLLPEFKSWLRPVESERTKASCTYCISEFYAKLSNIKKRAATTKRKKSSEPYSNSSQQKKMQYSAATESSCGRSEAALCLFICEHTAFLTADHLTELCKKQFMDSKSAAGTSMHRYKFTKIIMNVLFPHFLELLVADIGGSKYSLIIDEATDISTTNLLGVLVRYFSSARKSILTTFLALIELDDGTVVTIVRALEKLLTRMGLDKKHLLECLGEYRRQQRHFRDT
ncbi:hypothetical protein HPB51_022577 [Rhipicephalus microplus]|uniref:DUF4371 domain-containing protein n=1 Tax=Rhipicephalus microplus TaxID=6941 RepID=A0A9J6DIX6_RHIMP|nr:hypothetical protein HPB51_022577 [Rhipicephalus microplus]